MVCIADPTPLHLVKIAELYVQQRNIEFQEGLAQQLSQHLLDTYGKAPEGGVRFVRNLVDQAIRARVERISKQVSISKTNKKLTATDFGIGKELGEIEEIAKVIKEVENLIGIESAKIWLRKIHESIEFLTLRESPLGKTMYNLVLTGCPGTGKTTFARMIHRFLKAHGILTGEFIEKNALELKGEYVGTGPLVKAAFKDAKFGTLFIDEAYGLASENGRGGDTFQRGHSHMLTESENNRDNVVAMIIQKIRETPTIEIEEIDESEEEEEEEEETSKEGCRR